MRYLYLAALLVCCCGAGPLCYRTDTYYPVIISENFNVTTYEVVPRTSVVSRYRDGYFVVPGYGFFQPAPFVSVVPTAPTVVVPTVPTVPIAPAVPIYPYNFRYYRFNY